MTAVDRIARKLGACGLLLIVAAIATALTVSFAQQPRAHFSLNLNIRVFHVDHFQNGLRVYMRLPMPLAVAHLRGAEPADGLPAPPPFTWNRKEDGRVMHYLDAKALRADPEGLARIVADTLVLRAEGRRLGAYAEAARAYPAQKQPRFANLKEARAALKGPAYAEAFKETYVGNTVLDVQLFYPTNAPASRYTLGVRKPAGVPGEERLANLLLVHTGKGAPAIYRALGTLEKPFRVDGVTIAAARYAESKRTAWSDARRFTGLGIRHILEGADHVLFVLCLTIGALGLGNLLWRVTGFTLGHSLTLALGFFGFAPQAAWFVPAVETVIALTIIYAGVIALLERGRKGTFLVTAFIGLIHGLGFSFVLQQYLKVSSPNVWVSLASFNVGVEIGQVAIVVLVWPLLVLGQRYWPRGSRFGRNAVAAGCIAVAAVWTVERAATIFP
ncbi:MAG: HupE/UreJ family protein [Methyloligellaceae bacterium]